MRLRHFLFALLLLAAPAAAQESRPADGPVTIRERVELAPPSQASGPGSTPLLGTERSGGGIAGYLTVTPKHKPGVGSYRSFGGPLDAIVLLEFRRPTGSEWRSYTAGPAFEVVNQAGIECHAYYFDPQAGGNILFEVPAFSYNLDGPVAFEIPISQRDALPDTQIRARVVSVRDTFDAVTLPMPTQVNASYERLVGGDAGFNYVYYQP